MTTDELKQMICSLCDRPIHECIDDLREILDEIDRREPNIKAQVGSGSNGDAAYDGGVSGGGSLQWKRLTEGDSSD